MSLKLRPGPTSPLQPASEHELSRTIVFRHPAYPDNDRENILIELSACDDLEGGIGLHHDTALVACGILAGNVWNGYLKATRDGPRVSAKTTTEQADAEIEKLLTQESYYFYVPYPKDDTSDANEKSDDENDDEPPYKYPVCYSFKDWAFPHDDLPSTWRVIPQDKSLRRPIWRTALYMPTHLTPPEDRCPITGATDYLKKARLFPRSAREWFTINKMSRYNQNQHLPSEWLMDDCLNIISLRPDLRMAFRDSRMIIVPKMGRWTAHFYTGTSSLGSEYHNTTIMLDNCLSKQFLLARFAWVLFRWTTLRVEQTRKRLFKLRRIENGKARDTVAIADTKKGEVWEMDAKEWEQLSSNSRKRKADSEIDPPHCWKRQRLGRMPTFHEADSDTSGYDSDASITTPSERDRFTQRYEYYSCD